MPPITSLPPGYRRHAVLNPFNRRRSWIGLATVGLILIGAVMVLMIQVLTLRRSLQADWLERAVRDAALAPEPGLPALLLQAVVLVVAFYGIIVLHEAIHGAFFWLFTRRRPRFGFRDRAAFAAADPGVFLTRNQYLAATHAPLVVITGAGLALLLVLPPGAAALVGFLMIANAAGAPSDLRVAAWLFLQPRGALVRDNGAISVFVPAAERPVPAAAAPAADTTISMVRANVAVGGVSVATAAVLVAPFVLLWGADELWRGMDAIFRLQVLIPATIAGVVVHELLHMAGYLIRAPASPRSGRRVRRKNCGSHAEDAEDAERGGSMAPPPTLRPPVILSEAKDLPAARAEGGAERGADAPPLSHSWERGPGGEGPPADGTIVRVSQRG
jgi:hypothetical protein